MLVGTEISVLKRQMMVTEVLTVSIAPPKLYTNSDDH